MAVVVWEARNDWKEIDVWRTASHLTFPAKHGFGLSPWFDS
jgi:hypothetical protein